MYFECRKRYAQDSLKNLLKQSRKKDDESDWYFGERVSFVPDHEEIEVFVNDQLDKNDENFDEKDESKVEKKK